MSGRDEMLSPEAARVYALTMLGAARTRDEKRRALKNAVAAGFSADEALALLPSGGEALNPWQGVPFADEGMGADAFEPPPWPAWLADQRDPERGKYIERLCWLTGDLPGRLSVEGAEARAREYIDGLRRSIESAREVIAWDEAKIEELHDAMADGPGGREEG